MCGIAGFFSPKCLVSESDLIKMGSVIAHRGPDANGYYYNNTIGIVHQRLSIIDLSSSANQPFYSNCGRYAIVFNGEAYNYLELGINESLVLRTHSDTEVLLQLFIKKGPDFINNVNGMFAFAILDKQENSIWLYRDRIGIKPLFIYKNDNEIAFASEIKSITCIDSIKKQLGINYSACSSFLHYGYIPQPLSIYDKITKFPTGSYAKISDGGIEYFQYWNSSQCVAANTINNESEAIHKLEELLNQSVKLRLRSDVAFGAFLSGGVDSSLVSAIAQKQLTAPLKTFTIAFDNKKHNEARFAQQVADYLKTEHHEFKVTQQTAKELVGDIVNIMGEPFADSSIIPTMMVSKLASKHVKMTLSGDGGDELFMGYGAYSWANRLASKRVKMLRKAIAVTLANGSNRQKRAAHLFQFSKSDNLHSHIFSQEQYFFSNNELKGLLNNYISPVYPYMDNLSRVLKPNEEQAFFDLNYYLKDDLLVKVDRASMQYSLESRVPLLDHNVVEFALNVHHSLKMNNGVQKHLLKQVLYKYVPKHIFDRPKWGFSIPLNEWLKTDLKYLIDENLNKETVEEYGLINYKQVEQLKHLYLNKQVDYLYNRLWALILIHKFLRESSF